MKIEETLVLHEQHLTARTARFLWQTRAIDWPVPGGHFGDQGFFFQAVDENGVGADFAPSDLFDVLEYASGEGYLYVVITLTGSVCSDLPLYDRTGDEKRIHASQFMERKSAQELDEQRELEALGFLSTQLGFDRTDAHLSDSMMDVTSEVISFQSNMPEVPVAHQREKIQRLIDLASACTAIARCQPAELVESTKAVQFAFKGISELLDSKTIPDQLWSVLGEAHYRLQRADDVMSEQDTSPELSLS
ncbi:hypothetical protein [Rhizobium mesosinicum]|uniref:Uncharacterized protein n=1 Tax=Rhizobium mesosinicum TaxID=335017 RepID=A0ABS7GND2_9HYPH|nr:hypothetical protein [Rhizobium mesosinicum]MBW9051151.1 hypothetical protein [Rhizobium mesosinicum]